MQRSAKALGIQDLDNALLFFTDHDFHAHVHVYSKNNNHVLAKC